MIKYNLYGTCVYAESDAKFHQDKTAYDTINKYIGDCVREIQKANRKNCLSGVTIQAELGGAGTTGISLSFHVHDHNIEFGIYINHQERVVRKLTSDSIRQMQAYLPETVENIKRRTNWIQKNTSIGRENKYTRQWEKLLSHEKEILHDNVHTKTSAFQTPPHREHGPPRIRSDVEMEL